jgi:hypothetical protein
MSVRSASIVAAEILAHRASFAATHLRRGSRQIRVFGAQGR